MEGINSKRLVIWGFTPFGSFFQKRRFENQNLTKIKKQAFYFRLLLIYCTPHCAIFETKHRVIQKISNSKPLSFLANEIYRNF